MAKVPQPSSPPPPPPPHPLTYSSAWWVAWERDRCVCVCVCVWGRERECVCVWERERECVCVSGVCMCAYVCMCMFKCVSMNVCMCFACRICVTEIPLVRWLAALDCFGSNQTWCLSFSRFWCHSPPHQMISMTTYFSFFVVVVHTTYQPFTLTFLATGADAAIHSPTRMHAHTQANTHALFLSLSLCLCLCRIHTHTHTHTHFGFLLNAALLFAEGASKRSTFAIYCLTKPG